MTNDIPPGNQRTGLSALLHLLWPDSGGLAAEGTPPPRRVELANGLFALAYTSLIGSVLGAFLYGHWSGCLIPLALAIVLWGAGWAVFNATRASVRAAASAKRPTEPARNS